jgi:hypothetical protein
MSSILVSAALGAAGGMAGAGVAWVVGRVLGRSPSWLLMLPVVGIGIALAIARSLQPSVGDRLMAELDGLSSVQTLKTHYPADYEILRSRAVAFPQDGGSHEAHALTANVFARVLGRELPKADDASVHGLYQVTRAYAGALRDVDARGCYDMMEGKGAPPTLAKIEIAEIEKADMKATTRLLVQTATKPAPPARPMSFDELVGISGAALATMPHEDQDVALSVLREERDPRTPEENRIMCAFELAVADQLLALGPVAGGAKIRAMQAMK